MYNICIGLNAEDASKQFDFGETLRSANVIFNNPLPRSYFLLIQYESWQLAVFRFRCSAIECKIMNHKIATHLEESACNFYIITTIPISEIKLQVTRTIKLLSSRWRCRSFLFHESEVYLGLTDRSIV